MPDNDAALPLWKLAEEAGAAIDASTIAPAIVARSRGPLTDETIMGIQLQRGDRVLDLVTGLEGVVRHGTIEYHPV